MITTPTPYLEHYAENLEHAQRHWTSQHPEPLTDDSGRRVHALTVAVSREAGTPGTSVAREVGARLNWTVYDHELVKLIAQETGLRASLLESVDEKHKNWLLECLESLAASPGITEGGYARHVLETVVSLGMHGRCVIVGRGAAQILPPTTTLRVRLVGLLEDRIAAAAQQLGLSHDEATRWVNEKDHERIQFVKTHFFQDPTDPRLYDLMLNTSRWSVAECADFIVQALHQLEGHVSGTRS